MTDILVAGIAATSQPEELERILQGCAHLDTSRFAVLTRDELTQKHIDSPIHFVPNASQGVSTGSGGTGVPGMGGGMVTLSQFVGHSDVPNYLANMPIRADVAGNYNIAIHEGRSVITFRATEDEAESVAEQFRSCGLHNVKTFAPPGTETSTGTI